MSVSCGRVAAPVYVYDDMFSVGRKVSPLTSNAEHVVVVVVVDRRLLLSHIRRVNMIVHYDI